jgi:sensor histidine kinase regulating citrate/malate metabolism
VKALVVELGGELRLESGPRGETVMVMQLPLSEKANK